MILGGRDTRTVSVRERFFAALLPPTPPAKTSHSVVAARYRYYLQKMPAVCTKSRHLPHLTRRDRRGRTREGPPTYWPFWTL